MSPYFYVYNNRFRSFVSQIKANRRTDRINIIPRIIKQTLKSEQFHIWLSYKAIRWGLRIFYQSSWRCYWIALNRPFLYYANPSPSKLPRVFSRPSRNCRFVQRSCTFLLFFYLEYLWDVHSNFLSAFSEISAYSMGAPLGHVF